MSQSRRSDDVDNGSRRNEESEHQSTTVSAPTSLELEDVLLSRDLQHVFAGIPEPLVRSPISQLEHGNLGSQTNNSGSEDGSRPVSALMKVIELMVIRAVQHSIKPVIEDSIRRVAKEVIESEVEKILTRNSGNEMHSVTKILELQFCSNISSRVWTGLPIKGEGQKPVVVSLVDNLTRKLVDSGPEASAEVEIVVLKGDLDDEEDFEQNIVWECKGKNSLLKGNTYLKLDKGIGSLGDISFKHKSKWMRTCRLRLGARIVDHFNGTRVKEGKTEPFTVKDQRAKLYEKHGCPSLSDSVWQLKNIDKRGICCQLLIDNNIKTVQGFLTEFNLNPQGLQEILGSSMSAKMVNETVANAMKCELDDRIFLYSPGSQEAYGVVFNVVGQLLGVQSKGAYVPVDQLPETKKADAQEMVVYAFKHQEEVSCIDKNSLSCDSSDLSNVRCFSHLHRPESSSGHDSGNYHMINDRTQPHNSLPNIISSNPAFIGPNNGTCNIIDGYDTNRLHSSNLGIVENDIFEPCTSFIDCNPLMSPLNLLEFDFQTPNLQLDDFVDQGINPGMETPADQKSAECASVIVSAQAVAVGKVPSKWMRASAVLIVELIKRSVRSNVPKRQRCS